MGRGPRRRSVPPIRALAAVLLVLAAAATARAGALVVLQHQPGDATQPWTWRLIIDHFTIGRAAGYTDITLSPHEKACGGQWSLGYDPYDFRSFDSAHGTQKDLAELIGKAHAQGIQVYADMVMNHMCTNNFKYPRFSRPDF